MNLKIILPVAFVFVFSLPSLAQPGKVESSVKNLPAVDSIRCISEADFGAFFSAISDEVVINSGKRIQLTPNERDAIVAMLYNMIIWPAQKRESFTPQLKPNSKPGK